MLLMLLILQRFFQLATHYFLVFYGVLLCTVLLSLADSLAEFRGLWEFGAPDCGGRQKGQKKEKRGGKGNVGERISGLCPLQYHRLNGSSSPVLTATPNSCGSLCDFLTFPQPTRGHTPNRF